MSNLVGHTVIECHECQSTIFTEANMILKKSRLIDGDDKDSIIPVPVIICKNCGEIAKFQADDMTDIFALKRETYE